MDDLLDPQESALKKVKRADDDTDDLDGDDMGDDFLVGKKKPFIEDDEESLDKLADEELDELDDPYDDSLDDQW